MTHTLTQAELRQRLANVGFNQPSITKLMGVNPELALVAARAKEMYEAAHPGKSFQIEQGFRSRIQQRQIAALGSAYTNASGAKGHESPHQFGQAFDFHILENGVRQPDNRENDQDYKDVAASMRAAAAELGYGDKLNYGALGDVHVGHGKSRHNDWGHIEEKRTLWNQWRPGQGITVPDDPAKAAPLPGINPLFFQPKKNCIPCLPQKPAEQPFNIINEFLKPAQLQVPFKLGPG